MAATLQDVTKALAEVSVNMDGNPPSHVTGPPKMPTLMPSGADPNDPMFLLATFCMHIMLKLEHIHERTKLIAPEAVSLEVANAALHEFTAANMAKATWKDRAVWMESRLLRITSAAHDRQYLTTILRAQGLTNQPEIDARIDDILADINNRATLPDPFENLTTDV